MPRRSTPDEHQLIQEGLQVLRETLGHLDFIPSSGQGYLGEGIFHLTGPDRQNVSGPLLIEVKTRLTPAQVMQIHSRLKRLSCLLQPVSILVITSWASPRSRRLLDELGMNYVDLTGNVSFRLDQPLIRIHLEGAARDPWPRGEDGSRQLKGLKAGRLVRALVDVAPPYTAKELGHATGLSQPYVSRLLETLMEQGLIRREGRQITHVEWVDLLRARAEVYSFLKAPSAGYVAPQGPDAVLEFLGAALSKGTDLTGRVAVTGPVAAAAVAPLTLGGQLFLYVGPPPQQQAGPVDLADRAVLRRLRLLPQTHGGNVVLVAAQDPVVFTGTRQVRGVLHVALSQLALDCLTGPGRMPAEGEAILTYMKTNSATWRKTNLSDWQLPGLS
jgi:DNA-binding transcriptional ArsR family regulator